MHEETFDGHLGRGVVIDSCFSCQSFWFDARESLSLTPGSTLRLFARIGEHVTRTKASEADASKCPRCRARLRQTHDMQRATRFQYLRCPNGHGRFISFFEFLREKDFIRPLTPAQLVALRRNVQIINCSNCGAPVDLARGGACAHCASPLSILDLGRASELVADLQRADRPAGPVDPALPLQLARARREVESALIGLPREVSFADLAANGLVAAGLAAVSRWLRTE
jgi:Zn-finger nucleic acid-binding protein